MIKNISLVLRVTLAFPLLLGACEAHNISNTSPITPLLPQIKEPDNLQLKSDIRVLLADQGAPAASRYNIERVDLNNDKRRDAIVIFKTPYGYWCGTHGCTMMIFKANKNDFTLVNSVQPVREPVYIDTKTTNGWKNIITRVSGRWAKAKNVTLMFDGQSYPLMPDQLNPHKNAKIAMNRSTRLFHD